jgi:sugar lactone lactonase YvrE
METIGRPKPAHRALTLLSVALIVLIGLSGAPVADRARFPDRIPMAATPSGVAVDKPGNVYVSMRETHSGQLRGMIWRYAPDGTQSFVADVGAATIYGLYAAPNGDVYAAMAVPGTDNGVYRVDRDGHIELLPGSKAIVFPNGFAFDDRGNLYVTESFSLAATGGYGQGGIWRIPPRGAAELWLRDPLLTGLGLLGAPPAPVGANGVAFNRGALYVTNTDKHLVLRIPIEKNGGAGPIEIWKVLGDVPESPLAGSKFPIMPDGLALDVHGNLYMTILTRNAVIRLMADDRRQETVAVLGSLGQAPSALFDTPASLAFGTGAGEQQNLFVTNLGWMVRFIAGQWPGPSLLKVHAGMPGRPLT